MTVGDRRAGGGGDRVGVFRGGPTTDAVTVAVTFHGTAAATTSWSATSITATVPAGATTGNVVATVGGVASNGASFTVIEPDTPLRLACSSRISEPSGASSVVALLDPGDEPGADVTFAIAHTGTADEGDDYTVGTLTIEAGQTSGTMDPRLEVVDDTVSEGEETIELTVTAAGYEEAGCTIRLEDDEPAISGLEPAAGPVGTSVVITGANFGAAQGTSTVTFNGTGAATTSWSATSITAAVPAGAATGNVVVTVGGTASNGAAFTVTGVTVTPTELTIEEGGTGTYTVVLNSRPASAVTVSMFAPAGTDLSVDILPVFTASNWDEPQTVTVTAGEDEDQEDDTDTIAHRTASADASYHDLTVDGVEVTVTDNDAGAGVRVTPRELTIEEGEEGTYTVVLNTEPTADVTVAVTAGGDLTVMPGSLDFTTLDWDTAQEVTVTVGQDDDAEDETETITHAVTSTDTGYSGLAVDEVRVTIADDEGTGGPGGTEELTVSTTRLRITEGNMGKYTVVLNREPAAGVTVAVSAPSGGDLTVMPATLDFTTLNWDTPQEVRVTAGEDTDLEDEVESITHTITRASSSSSSSLRGALGRQAAFATAMGSPAPTREYVYLGGRLVAIQQGGAVSEASVVVTIDDDDDPDTPGVPALTSSLRLTEGHTGAYTLELGAAPTAPVTIALTVSRGSDNVADVTVNPTPLTFTASDWDAPQWVTVRVGEDSDTVGETETITHAATSTDSRYEGITIAPVRVVIRDRNRATDPPTGTLGASPDPCTIAAGATTCSTTLTWTSTNTNAVQVRRIRPKAGSTSSINEIVVRSGSPNGQTTFSRIDLTESPFYLYEYITSTRRRGRQLATVTVQGVKELTLSPDSGPVGTSVTITGSGFGDSQGTSTVTLGGAAVSPTSWSDTEIVFEVPQNATAGDHMVKVTVGGVERTIGTFEVTDGTSQVECAITAAPNPCIIAAGQSTCTSTLTWTSMNTTAVRVWTEQQELTPFGYVGGLLTAFTTTDSTSGDQVATINPAPRVRHKFAVHDHSGGSRGAEVCSVIVTGDRALSISPTSGPVGTVVTIMGSRFEARQGLSTVTFNGTTATPTSWSDTSITVPVPAGATSGPVKVTVAATPRTIGTFTVTPPPTVISPTSGPVGTSVMITGSGFGTQGPGNRGQWLTFNGTRAEPTSWSDTEIVVEVPDGATSGPVARNSIRGGRVELGPFTVTTDPDPDPDPPAITSFTANPTAVDLGEQSTLSWTVSGATGLSIDQDVGSVTPVTSGTKTVTPKMDLVTTTYTLTASDGTGTDTETADVTINAPGITCSADPETVDPGGSSTLSWTATSSKSVSITPDPGGGTPGTSGPKTVTPSSTTTYTFTATGSANRTATCSARVTVTTDRPTIDSFTPSAANIKTNGSSTLSWQTSNAKAVTLNGTAVALDGSQVVRPSTTEAHEYTLAACADNCGTDTGNKKVTEDVTVTVWEAPTIGSCSASSANVKTNSSSELRWTVSNARTVTVDGTSVTVNRPHTVTLSTAGIHTYTVKASNPGWTGTFAASCSITVTAWDRPTAEISANRTSINEGQPVTVSWSSSNAQTTVITGIGGIGTVTGNSSGSRDLAPAQGSHSYGITASNPAWTGSDASDSETVTVDAKPTGTISASPNPCTIAASASSCTTTLTWSGSGTTGLWVKVSHNGSDPPGSFASSGRTGSQPASWIQQSPAHSYVFYLYDYENRVQGAQLASVTVRGVKAPPAPLISSLSRTQGNPDTQVTIYGANFGSTEDSVTFSGSTAEINSWSDIQISVQVPGELGRGTVKVKVTANSLDSNEVDFTVIGDPVHRDPDEECEDPKDCPEDEEEEESTPDP